MFLSFSFLFSTRPFHFFRLCYITTARKEKNFIIIRVPPPNFYLFVRNFLWIFCSLCLSRWSCPCNSWQDKWNKRNWKKKKKIKIVLKYTLTLINQNAIYVDTFHGMKFHLKKRSVKVSLDALSSLVETILIWFSRRLKIGCTFQRVLPLIYE